MGRTYANQYFSTTLYYTYYCSACGAKNHKQKVIKTTGQASRHGTWHSKATKEKLLDKAYDSGASNHKMKITQIFYESEIGKYETAELRARCALCGHREPWAKMHFSWIDILCTYIIIFGFLSALICLVEKLFINAALAFFIPILLDIFLSLFRKFRIKAIEKEIAKLPKNALPVFSFKDDDFYKN